MDIKDLKIDSITKIKPINDVITLCSNQLSIDFEGVDIDDLIDACIEEDVNSVIDKISIENIIIWYGCSALLDKINRDEAIKHYNITEEE